MNNKLQIDTLYEYKRKKPWICYLLWLLLGGIGTQHFYIQGSGSGYAWCMIIFIVLSLFTPVFTPVWFVCLFYGLFTIRRDVRLKNLEIKMDLEKEYAKGNI